MAYLEIGFRPPEVILSKTPAWFEVMYLNENNPEGLINATISVGAEIIGQDFAFASLNNSARFELSQYFDIALKPENTYVGETANIVFSESLLNLQSKTFTITFSDHLNNSLAVDIIVLKGEFYTYNKDQFFYSGNYYDFWDFLVKSKRFLSFKPSPRLIFYEKQPERLYFLIANTALASGLISVNRTLYFADGSTSNSVIGQITPELGKVYGLRCSYHSMITLQGDHSDLNPVVAFDVFLTQGGSEVSTKENFIVKSLQNNQHNTTFIFLNSIGGFDCFVANGKAQTSFDYSLTQASHTPTPYKQLDRHVFYDQTHSVEYKVNTGFICEKTMQWLFELVQSPKAYIVINPDADIPMYLPIRFIDNKIEVQKNTGSLMAGELSYIYNPVTKAEEFFIK